MRIVCIGGGPAGLYFGLLMKKQNPANDVTVVERNRPYDTFGWGVVFSDQTLGNLRRADEASAAAILDAFNHWDDIDIHINGRTQRSSGHGFCGIGRKRLLNILQERAEALGVKLVFETQVTSDETYDADLIIACDGANSVVRTKYAATYKPDIDLRDCRFVWLGTDKLFDAFTFAFEKTEFGWFQAHAYRFDDHMSTFIVEAPERVWRAAGLDESLGPEQGQNLLGCKGKVLPRGRSDYGKRKSGKKVIGCSLTPPQYSFGVIPLALLFQLQLALVFFQKFTEFLGLVQQADPLLVIKGDGKTAKAVHAYAALFAYLELHNAGALLLGFQFGQFRLELFVCWFSHASPL